MMRNLRVYGRPSTDTSQECIDQMESVDASTFPVPWFISYPWYGAFAAILDPLPSVAAVTQPGKPRIRGDGSRAACLLGDAEQLQVLCQFGL